MQMRSGHDSPDNPPPPPPPGYFLRISPYGSARLGLGARHFRLEFADFHKIFGNGEIRHI